MTLEVTQVYRTEIHVVVIELQTPRGTIFKTEVVGDQALQDLIRSLLELA